MTEQTLQTYRAARDGWIAGRRVTKGEEIELTDRQAKYEMGGIQLAPVEPGAAKPASAKPATKRGKAPEA
ncbi:MAG: hypothetical protein AAF192_11520 [Pseudomonadota bacterium]